MSIQHSDINIYGSTTTGTLAVNAGNITLPNTTSYGLQDVSGTAWFRPRDTSNNLHIRTSSGGIYLDTDGTHYFRNVAGTVRGYLDGTNGGGRLLDSTTYSFAANMNQNVRTTDNVTHATITGNIFTMPQNPVGTAYYGVAAQPTYYIGQTNGDNDYWKIYGESTAGSNSGALILQSEDDFDSNESIRLRFKRTYSAYNTNDTLVAQYDRATINGIGIINGNAYIGSTSQISSGRVSIWAGGAGGVGWGSGLNIGDASNYTGFIQDAGTSRWRNFGNGNWDWYNNNASVQIMSLSNGGTLYASADMRAPIFYDSTSTGYYLDPASTTTSLQIAGAIEQGNNLAYPRVEWGATGATGPVIIKLPGNTGNYGMIHAVIDIYEYNGNNVSTVIVGGHNWGGSQWYNYGANLVGYTDKPVRVGIKDGQYCIVIGNGSSSWSYGQVVLRKIQNGTYYDNVMDLGGSYSIGIGTDTYTWVSGDLRGFRTTSISATGTISASDSIYFTNYLYGNGKQALDTTDSYLRLNQANQFSSGTYTPYNFRADGTIYVGGTSYYISSATSRLYDLTIENGGSDNTKINLKSSSTSGYSALRFNYAGAEQHQIHAFGSTWSSGFPLASQGAINLSPLNGVTFGSWNSPGAWIYNNGQAQFQNSVRSPIFYDSDDTAYYINAANNSILSTLRTGGAISYNTGYGATLFGVKTASGKFLTDNWQHADGAYTWPGTTYRTGLSDVPIGSTTIAGAGAWVGHRQAGWTPVDTSKTYKISVWIRTTSGNPYCYLSLTQAGYDLSQPTNGGWGNPYFWNGVPSSNWTEYTMTIGPSGAGYTFNSGVKYVQLGWLHNYLYSGYSGQAEIAGFRIEELDNNLAGGVTALGTIYATQFIDSDSPSYYVDPSGTSNINYLQNGSVWINNGTQYNNYNENIRLFNAPNGVSVIAFSASGTSGMPVTSILGYSDRLEYRYNNSAVVRMYNGYTEIYGSTRSPIYYDYTNTGYYTDPEGTSRIGGGIDFNGGAGLRSVNAGTSYQNHIQIREASGYGGNTSAAGAPALGFHWSGIVASNIALETSGRIAITNNPGTSYENFIANNIYGYAFYGTGNVGGTGAATYHPSGIYSTGTNWLYGTMYLNVNQINDAGDIRLYNASYHFRARYTPGSDIYHASLNWYGLQLGNNGDNFIIAGRTNVGGRLRFYVNNTSDFTSVNGTEGMRLDNDGRLYSYVDTRSPIFYNYSDTGYYIDGESVSRLAILRIISATSGYSLMLGPEQTTINGVTHVYNDNARYSLQINGPYYPHLGIGSTANSGNTTHGPVLSFQGWKTAGGYRRFGMGIANQNPDELSFGWYDNDSNPHYGVGINWSYPATMWYNTSHDFYVRNGMYSYAWYDRDNTAFRIDATSSSRLSSLTVDNAITAPGVLGYARKIDNVSREAFTVGGNASTFYPVAFYMGAGATGQQYGEFVIERGGYDDPGYSGIGFSTCNIRFSIKASGWGFGATYEQLEGYYSTFNAMANWEQFGQASYLIVWLRGATVYYLWNVVGTTSVQFANSGGGNYDRYYGSTYFSTDTPTTTIQDKASYSKNYNGSLRVEGNIKSAGQVYGTEFRDVDNTGYYSNPASDSRLNTTTNNRYYWYGVGGDSGQGGDYYSMYQEAGGWTYPYPDLIIANHTGIKIGGYYGYNGTRFYNNSPHAGSLIASIGDGDNNLRGYADIIAYASDRRLKENFRPLENAITRVQSLNGYLFDWKDNVKELGFEPNKKTEVGIIAQDVEAVLPEAVAIAPFDYDWKAENGSKSGERYLTVKYEKIVPLLIEAIKEQQTQIDELKETINNLQK